MDRLVVACFALCAAICAGVSLRWPLMGDATYMHYAVRMIHAGMHPYADLIEMNMPGSYLLEIAYESVFGASSLGLRLYDLSLSLSAVVLLTYITRRHLAGFCSGAFLVILHAQDGVMMGGERDYAMAVLLLLSVFALLRSGWLWTIVTGFSLGAAICIKPTAIVFLPLCMAWLGSHAWRKQITLLAATSFAPLACWLWLVHWHAVDAFGATLHGLVRLHASIDNKPIAFLLIHSVSPIAVLFCVWLVGTLLQRHASREAWFLRACVLCGWLCYALQRKGFSYQRYPMLVFLLLIIAYDLATWVRSEKRTQYIAVTGIAIAVGLALMLTTRVTQFSVRQPETALAHDITSFGHGGTVQCMDTAGPCIAGLERLHLLQATGLLYDCYLTQANNPITLGLRQRFMNTLLQHAPHVLVITNSVCYGEPRRFDKYQEWPAWDLFLSQNYTLVQERIPTQTERYWSRATLPFAWRIYIKKQP